MLACGLGGVTSQSITDEPAALDIAQQPQQQPGAQQPAIPDRPPTLAETDAEIGHVQEYLRFLGDVKQRMARGEKSLAMPAAQPGQKAETIPMPTPQQLAEEEQNANSYLSHLMKLRAELAAVSAGRQRERARERERVSQR